MTNTVNVSDDSAHKISALESELNEVIHLWRKLKVGTITLERYNQIMSSNFGSADN